MMQPCITIDNKLFRHQFIHNGDGRVHCTFCMLEYPSSDAAIKALFEAEGYSGEDMKLKRRKVKLGVIEFHSESYNPGLVKRFFEVTEDLRESASIIDIWLMDIAAVLKEFGYDMTVTTTKIK